MSISVENVEKIAELARLELLPDELQTYVESLSNILQLVEQMNEVETDTIEPMAHPQDCVLRLREDEVTETDKREAIQAIAPETENGLYLVPRVIE